MRVRIYGPSRSFSSFRAITRGYLQGFADAGAQVDFMATDGGMDEDEVPPGTDAPLGILFGDPTKASLMHRHSVHKRRLVMIAPNSTMIPGGLLSTAASMSTGFLSPSKWGASVIGDLMQRGMPEEERVPISILHHGVGGAFDPERLSPGKPPEGPFRALHITSTSSSRKSTFATAVAFARAAGSGLLGEMPELVIECDPVSFSHWKICMEREGITRWVKVFGIKSRPWDSMGEHYREFDAVVQPSRAEGFGLVPLEAMCSGVPVVATTCTGHAEFLGGYSKSDHPHWTEFVVRVPHGEYEDMGDDGEGAMAPEVREQDIEAALIDAFRFREMLHRQALSAAPYLYKRWSWTAVSRAFLEQQAADLGESTS